MVKCFVRTEKEQVFVSTFFVSGRRRRPAPSVTLIQTNSKWAHGYYANTHIGRKTHRYLRETRMIHEEAEEDDLTDKKGDGPDKRTDLQMRPSRLDFQATK